MKTFITYLSIILSIQLVTGQEVSKNQVVEGLSSLRNSIIKYNPALGDYNPNFESQAKLIIDRVDQDTYSQIEYFRHITEMCAISNEGHFAIGSWSDTPHSGFASGDYRYLPISIQLLNGKIYLWNDYSNENSFERGDEILEINRESSTSIIEQLMKYAHSDGDIVGYAHRSIGLGFNWMYYLYIDAPDTFRIKYKKLNGAEQYATIDALNINDLSANYKERITPPTADPESVADVYELDINDTNATLKLKSFNRSLLERYSLKSSKLYNELFESISNAEVSTLIIDLRDNNGGRKEFANDMVPYIMQTESDDPFLRKSISWEGKEKTLKLPKQNKNYYQGKVIVIVNAGTYSAASTLARFLKEYANATVVGQETGTRYEGFSAGSKQYVNVPHTDVKIGIPRYQTIFSQSTKQTTSNRGLIPDHIITYTIHDVINEKDLEMEFIKANLIQE